MLAFQRLGGEGEDVYLCLKETWSFRKLISHTKFEEFFSMNVKEESIVSSAIIIGLKMQICFNEIKIIGKNLNIKQILLYNT